MTKVKKFFKMLTLIDGVNTGNWKVVTKIVDLIAKEKINIKEKKWNDRYKESHLEHFPLDLTNISTWSTFEDTCVDLRFYNYKKEKNDVINQLACEVKIYDGNSFNGQRQQLRFTATLWIPTSFLQEIEDVIDYAFERYLENAYEDHLETTKKLWMHTMKNEILNS